MALRKYRPLGDTSSVSMVPLDFQKKALEKVNGLEPEMTPGLPFEADVDIDLREVYFLIMHFLSSGPCKRTYGQLWNELLEHQLLPRRYHAWYSRNGTGTGDEDDDGVSLPLCYLNLAERYPHIEKDHLVKLLKQLIVTCSPQNGIVGANPPNAADVPTLLGTGSFSLLGSSKDVEDKKTNQLPRYLRWPHMQSDQVRGLSLREIGGGFTKHHRAPSVRAACYAIAKPSTLVQKMEIIKKMRGHQNAVYCAIFDRSGQYVITGSDDRLVKIWSMETAFCLASCRGHEGDITDLAVSSNNALVASSSNDFIIRVWRLPDGLPISVLRGHTGAVTAIAFSPRPSSVYQLLSSSDDGTCRIWDARYSQTSPRIYMPKPPYVLPGKSNDPAASTSQQKYQILCCAYNANGTVFVSGSSDTYARVWNACKSNTEDSDQPIHEMDLLSGHENDVNYVQFSGCAVASRSSTADALKEDNLPKFKNSWFTHGNIVTCSRDGSAIIWIPRSHRSHGKVGRWTRAYHLKVPPPPMPPQPPRGGPRQRFQPTPRGVNMIVWSLDNRFVLAAIMDCRICVWNASDGSLVHSLIGHTQSTFVLDVHPFNPRIAMSAGYDGITIIWDIWEGTPVRIYDIGRFKLVDGKFSPDGMSIVLSDEVGQIFIIATGQGESQKDAQYDQFFLGDYRPLIQDTHGNFLDQETQLAPYRRNIQDLLCDSSMIPYPEPYQNMYQQRRLGILGIEWRPPSMKFAVGPTYNVNSGDFQTIPIIDLDRWVEPLPEFADAMDWDQENEMQSDDNDSEYNVTDEYSSEGEHASLSGSSSGDPECSAEEVRADHGNKEGLRRSRRKRHKSEAEFTSSGRRVKRRNLDERDGIVSRTRRTRKSKSRGLNSKKSSTSKSLRPQRRAARNALNLFSKIHGGSSDGEEEEEDDEETTSSESDAALPESNTQSNESERSNQTSLIKLERDKDASGDEFEDVGKPPLLTQTQANVGNKRRLVFKLPRRDSKAVMSSEIMRTECREQAGLELSNIANADATNLDGSYSGPSRPNLPLEGGVEGVASQNGIIGKIKESEHSEKSDQLNLSGGCKGNTIKWGEVKIRSSKRFRLGDALTTETWSASNTGTDGQNVISSDFNGHPKSDDECGMPSNSLNQVHGDIDQKGYKMEVNFQESGLQGSDGVRGKGISPEYVRSNSLALQNYSRIVDQQEEASLPAIYNGDRTEMAMSMHEKYQDSHVSSDYGAADELPKANAGNNGDDNKEVERIVQPVYRKLRIKTKGLMNEASSSSSKLQSVALDDRRNSECEFISAGAELNGENLISAVHEDEDTSWPTPDHHEFNSGSCEMQENKNGKLSISHNSRKLNVDSEGKTFNAVYRRSKSFKIRKNSEGDVDNVEERLYSSNHVGNVKVDFSDNFVDGVRRTRSMGLRALGDDLNPNVNNFKPGEGYGFAETSRNGGKTASNGCDQLLSDEWKSASRPTLGLRSARNRRENYSSCELRPLDKRKYHQPLKKLSWLILLEHEESYRYIPQQGDEVAYLRQGHEEYVKAYCSQEPVPWKFVKGNLKPVEFCKVRDLDYSTLPGSGESCCKLTLEFTDPSSCGFEKAFKLTLPELVAFPDFLVERARFEAAIERNWTHRDKCQVWWRNEDGDGGSWWEGRILAVKPKSPDYPDSPWESCVIQYRNDSSGQHLHSPWELHDADSQWVHPHIDDRSKNKLLASFAKLEQTSMRNQDYHGVQKLNQAAQKSDFLNRFPVPLSLEVIKRRLENNYYRNLEAVKHDTSVMLSNAESYFGKSAEMTMKMRRLSDWIKKIF